MDNSQQELMFKLSMFEQQIRHLQQQIQAVERGIIDMTSLNFGLDELKGGEGKEIFAPIGRGIFAKTKLLSEELTVDIGGGNFVKKSISETKKIIEEQIKKLEDAKDELEMNLERIGRELERTMIESQGKAHPCGDNCKCENKDDKDNCECGDECECE